MVRFFLLFVCWKETVQQVAPMLTMALYFTDDKRIWPLLAAYGAHAATTTIACLATVLADQHVTQEQRTMLLCSYVPYLVIPAVSHTPSMVTDNQA